MKQGYVEVIRADGHTRRFPLGPGRITLGSSAEATIALTDAPELEPLHLLLAPRDDGCWVSAARDAIVAPRRNGKDFENGLLPWGSELDVGAYLFRFDRDENDGSRRRRLLQHARKGALVVALLWMASIVFGGGAPALPRTDAEPPALFEAELEGRCPGRAEEAAGRGDEALEAARAKAERYPFAPRDGVEAVYLFARAEACLARAGDRDLGAWASEQRLEMAGRVDEDYRVHRLRLARALERRRYRDALRQTRTVADLLRHRDGDYVAWLARLERALVLRVSEEDGE